ncbi:MAG: hypothetical protein ACQGVC_01560 [Myxococcota bacterium]
MTGRLRWIVGGVWLLAGVAACFWWMGSGAPPAPTLAEPAADAPRTASVSSPAPIANAVLTDEVFAPPAEVVPAPTAPPSARAPVAEASPPLPADITFVIGAASDDLAISLGPDQLDIFQSALDVGSPLDAPVGPAAPAPDLR